MPKSTIAVSLIAIFLLGYLIGSSRGEKVAAAVPTLIPNNGNGFFLATSDSGDSATLWSVDGYGVSRGIRYSRSGKSRQNGTELLDVTYLVLPEEPAAPKTPPK